MMSSSRFSRYLLFFGQWVPSKVCQVGTRWMRNLIPHPTSSLDRNLSKLTGRYVKNTNKKVVFFFSSSKINKYYFIIFLRRPILDPKIPLMMVLYLKFLRQGLNGAIQKMCALITHQNYFKWLDAEFNSTSNELSRSKFE